MSYKNKVLLDRPNVSDKNLVYRYPGNGIRNTRVEITDLEGNPIFKGSNKIILPGSIFTATKHFDIKSPVTLPNYNLHLGLDNSVETEAENVSKVCLFGVGTDGCAAESSQIVDVNYMKWLSKENMIPFVYRSKNDDISDDMRKKYFGRKTIEESGKIAYYFKAFESDPEMVVQYIDGTSIDSKVYESNNTTIGEVYVLNRLRVTTTDCREFFKATVGLNKARINTIIILQAWKKEIGGYTYYQDIEPIAKVNFDTEFLVDESKGLDIKYYFYY